MNPRYEIIITCIESVTRTTQAWEKIADSGNPADGKSVYGYVSKISDDVKCTELFKQSVEGLDLPAIIAAVNGLTLTAPK